VEGEPVLWHGSSVPAQGRGNGGGGHGACVFQESFFVA